MSNTSQDPVLKVNNLDVEYRIDFRWQKAIEDFEVEVFPRQIYGIVGESGSGKSTVIKAVMKYLSNNGRVSEGDILFDGKNLATTPRRQMRKLWGGQMHMVPQNAFTALNPSIRIGEQIAEIVRIHTDLDKAGVQQRVIDMLANVRLADPEKVAKQYPHEISGGQQQRVVLAMAFVTSPELLLLDEPTTSLDVTTEATILDLIRDLIDRSDAGAIYVTHNLGVVAQFCDRVIVMYAGEIMEDASVDDLYGAPIHPYTIGLLSSIPQFGQSKYDESLHTVPGRPPNLSNRVEACAFADRCPIAVDKCFTEKPPLETVLGDRKIRCHRWQEIDSGEVVVEQGFESGVEFQERGENDVILNVESLTKHFNVRLELPELIKKLSGEEVFDKVRAVDDVQLRIQRGKTLGLVGESGSGKTTLSRMIVGLIERTSGNMQLVGGDVAGKVGSRSKDNLKQLQMIFQNPADSLNPYLRVSTALRRPLQTLAGLNRSEATQQAKDLLVAVNLDESYMSRFPGELSGGEKQRVAIARAFASTPELIVCDEPVSALDVSVQSAVLNLLAKLQQDNDTAYLFISHDLAVVGYLADYIAVMYLGEIFEVGDTEDLFAKPYHPYTEALVSAIPIPDPHHEASEIRLSKDVPSPRNLPTGCRFHTRCPRKIGDICEDEIPPWRSVNENHHIRCHIPIEDLMELQTDLTRTAPDDQKGEDV